MHSLPPGRVLLAFSGGPDSVGLAAALAGQEILLGYADHRLRGSRAARNERGVVSRAARALGLPLRRIRLSVAGSSEGAARYARYTGLEALARKHGCTALATAHTADDLAETVIFNLMRGTGLRGLASLRPRANIGTIPRIRPALDERRDALRAWGAGIASVNDPTNRCFRYSRARLRSVVLPSLRRLLGEDPVPLICRLAEAATRVRGSLETRAGDRPGATRRDLLAEPEVAFPYLVEALRCDAGAQGPPLTGNAYRSLRAFLNAGNTGKTHRTPGGEAWTLISGGRLLVERTESGLNWRPEENAGSPRPPSR